MRMPQFTGDAALYRTSAHYSMTRRHDRGASGIVPARITCPVPGLAVLCMALGAPAFLFPCFGNECCVLGFGALQNPACLACSCD
jgi:hypothetical protein